MEEIFATMFLLSLSLMVFGTEVIFAPARGVKKVVGGAYRLVAKPAIPTPEAPSSEDAATDDPKIIRPRFRKSA